MPADRRRLAGSASQPEKQVSSGILHPTSGILHPAFD
jgi:hypothetical protein